MWSDYFLYLLKTVTFLVAFIIIVGVLIKASKSESGGAAKGKLSTVFLNKQWESLKSHMQQNMLSKKALKALEKDEKAKKKQQAKAPEDKEKAFSILFKGDIQASQVESLRREVTAILSIAEPGQEVVVSLESPGGAVSGYGLAASQLIRLKEAGLKLTICIDKVAASGGYMMACVGDRIYAAPFAIVGSIGVLSQVPNVHRFLKRFDVDVDVLTAGKHKAPLTLMGKNTEEGRQKHLEDLNAIHQRFKTLVSSQREQLDIDAVSEGDFWLAEDAIELNLVDEIKTSDEYLQSLAASKDVYRVTWEPQKSLEQRLKGASSAFFESAEALLKKRWLP
ncbi:protease SohB [Reinekea forsetii]|nr:protease SohB [Reinekea forsetii]